MTSPARVIAAVACALALAGTAAAAPTTPPPTLQATSYILVQPRGGEILAQRGADLRLPMASTTKMMTALLALERTRPDDLVTVPAEAVAVGESSGGLVAGEQIRMRDLLTALMVASGNDAAVAVADHVAGSQQGFVDLMNERARELGLRRTHFANPHGLDAEGHYSSVRDLVRLGRALYAKPLARQIVAGRTATIPGPFGSGERTFESENGLLSIMPEADGIKTGHTDGAGYALVAHATSPETGVQLFAAIIGEPSEEQRAQDARRLLTWGLSQYARPVLLPGGRVLANSDVRDRPGVTLPLRVGRPLTAAIRLGEPVRATVVAPPVVIAPVRSGQPLGSVVLRQGRVVLGRRDLVAARDVSGPSLGDRLRSGWDQLLSPLVIGSP